MSEMSTSDLRKDISGAVNRAAFGKERLVLTRHGKGVAAIVPVEDLALLEALEDRIDLDEARKAIAEADRKGWIPLAKVKKDLGL